MPPDPKRKRPGRHSGAPSKSKLITATTSTPATPHAQSIFPVRLQRAAEHLCDLGPRAVGELLLEIGHETDALPLVMDRAAAYQRLQPEVLKALGGDGVHHPSGMILFRCPVFVKGDRAWAAPPAKPIVSRDGSVARSSDGKNRYEQVVGFTDRWTQERWSNAVVEALRAEHPEALA